LTPHAEHLLALARRAVDPFVSAGAHAVLVAGSVAEGSSDEFSDVDLVLFYDELRACTLGCRCTAKS